MGRPRATSLQLAALFAADVISTAGTEMTAVALPWFVLVSTGSPVQLGTVLTAEFAGMTVLGLWGGRVATRLGPRGMMLFSDGIRAALVGLVPLLHWLGVLSLPVLVVVGFAVGAFFPAYSSSQRLVLAAVVGDDAVRLTRTGGLMSSVNEFGSFAGPAVGGVLVAVSGPQTVLLVDVASYLVAFALVFALVPAATSAPEPEESAVLPGLRYLLRHKALRGTVAGIGIIGVGWTAMVATLPIIAMRTSGGAAVAGWLLAAYGGGSVIGGLVSARARTANLEIGTRAIIVAAACNWLLLLPTPWWVKAGAVAGNGVCAGIFFPRFFSALTTNTPPELRARVMTSVVIATSAPAPLGFLGAGLLSQLTGTPTASLVLIGVSGTIGAYVIARSRRPETAHDAATVAKASPALS